jgi:hypothetical protein
MAGTARGCTNAFYAIPKVGLIVNDYITSLKGLEYRSDEYINAR